MFKKVVSYSIGLYLAAVFGGLIRVLVKSIIAKTLSKDALGSYAYFNTILLLGGALLALGLKRTIAKEVAARKDEKAFAPLIAAVMIMLIAVSLILAIASVVLWQKLNWIYALILIAVGPAVLFDITCATFRGQFERNREVAALLIGAIIQAICITIVILLTRNSRAPVWGLTIAYGLLAVAVVFYFRHRFASAWLPKQIWQTFQSGQVVSLLALSTPLWVSDILDIVLNQADQIIVQGRLGYNILAEYAAAFTFIGLMDQPITILSRVFLVTFASGNYDQYEQYQQVTSLNLAFFTVLSLCVVCLAVPLTPIVFTSSYTLVPVLVMILSVSFVMHSIEVVNSALTIAKDYPQANRNAKIWITALYIPLMYFLVSRFGVFGAAWGNAITWLGYTAIHALYMRKRLPDHAQHTLRSLVLGTALYLLIIGMIWLIKSNWLVLLAIPLYLGLGQLIGLWDLAKILLLARRFLLERSFSVR